MQDQPSELRTPRMRLTVLCPIMTEWNAVLYVLLSFWAVGASAQAPYSISGRTFAEGIADGTSPFSGSGYYIFLPATSGSSYQVIGIHNVENSGGTYSYAAASPAAERVNLSDSAAGSLIGDLLFSGPSAGTLHLTATTGSAYQNGEFEMFSGQVPSSIAGKSFLCTVDDGLDPFAQDGSFVLTMVASGNTYRITGDGIADSSGTYSYAKVNATTAKIQLSDSVVGRSTVYAAFSDPIGGGFGVIAPATGGFQTGHFVVLDTTKPAVSIVSPRAGGRITNGLVNIQGIASDDIQVVGVWYQLNYGGWRLATGTTEWTATAALRPGTYNVRVYAEDKSGNISTPVSENFVYVQTEPITVQVNGAGTVTPNYNGDLLEIGRSYTITATPGAGYVMSNWTGNVSAATPKLTFVMQSNMVLQANFVPNPFLSVNGAYNGLFYDTNEVAPRSAGYFTAATTRKGAFSARVQLAGRRYSLSGQFDLAGQAEGTIPRPGTSPLHLELQLDLHGGDRLSGRVSDGSWSADLVADRATFNSIGNPAPQAGKYTLVIPTDDSVTNCPAGDGFGAVTVDGAGQVRLRGALADGVKLTQSTGLSRHGQWPFYASLYGGHGLALSWITFTNQTATDFEGALHQIKPALATTRLYPGGFAMETTALGSRYVSPGTTNRVLDFTNGLVAFDGGNLLEPFTNRVTLSANNKITNLDTNELTLAITLSSGLLKGSATDPASGKAIVFKGAVLQRQNYGAGYFLGTNQNGRVFFGPP